MGEKKFELVRPCRHDILLIIRTVASLKRKKKKENHNS